MIVKCKKCKFEYDNDIWKYCISCWYKKRIGLGLTKIDDWNSMKEWK